jgi:hypothetical protein
VTSVPFLAVGGCRTFTANVNSSSTDDGPRCLATSTGGIVCLGTIRCVEPDADRERRASCGLSDRAAIVCWSAFSVDVDGDGRRRGCASCPQKVTALFELGGARKRLDEDDTDDVSSHTLLVKYVSEVIDVAEQRFVRAPFDSKTSR